MTTSGKYEFWLCDDAGRKLELIQDYAYVSYSRAVHGYGVIEIGLPYHIIVRPRLFFQPDWRIDVWRSPGPGFPLRRECSFLIRKFRIYRRQSDGLNMIVYYGRSPIDLLRRFGGYSQNYANFGFFGGRSPDAADADGDNHRSTDPLYQGTSRWDLGTSYTHLMQGLYEIAESGMRGEVLSATRPYDPSSIAMPVDFRSSNAPFTTTNLPVIQGTANWFGKSALDACNEIVDVSLYYNTINPANLKVYFDVVEDVWDITENITANAGISSVRTHSLPGGFGYVFRAYAGLRGMDRTENGVIFSVENGNLIDPQMTEDWLDAYNDVHCNNSSNLALSANAYNLAQINASRWNHTVLFQSGSYKDKNDALQNAQYQLRKNSRERSISATFQDSPGGVGQPRSLYGLDWDLGDLVRVTFAGFGFTAEVKIIYVSIDEDGRETVTGRNEIGS